MKIIFVTEISGGGVEKVNVCLASEILKRGYDTKIISLVTKSNVKNAKVNDIDCIYLNKSSKKMSLTSLIKTLKQEKPDIIITNCLTETYYAIIYKNICRKLTKIIYVQHSVYSTTLSNNLKNTLRNKIIPKITNIFNLIDGLIFVSNGVKKDFYRCMPKVKTKNIVIYNPITNNDEILNYKEMNKENVHIVTAGRIEQEKNQEMIINAIEVLLSKNFNVDLTIYGEGTKKEYLKKICIEKNIYDRVNFKGFTYKLQEELKKYDIFVLSSNYESFGNVLVEAMNACIPVISTNCPVGPKEILGEGEYGRLTRVGDYTQLSEMIEKTILEDNKNIVERAFFRSKVFSVNNSVDIYIKFIEELESK